MMELTKEQLQALTDEIADRLGEFELPNKAVPTRGMVRVFYDVITAFQQRQIGAVTPLRSQVDDIDATAKRQAEFDAIVAEMKRVAMSGVMPKMPTWDAVRPAHLPKAQALMNKYQKTWTQMAEIAGLSIDRKGGSKDARPHINGTWEQ